MAPQPDKRVDDAEAGGPARRLRPRVNEFKIIDSEEEASAIKARKLVPQVSRSDAANAHALPAPPTGEDDTSVMGSTFGIDFMLLALCSKTADVIPGAAESIVDPELAPPTETGPTPESTVANPSATDEVASANARALPTSPPDQHDTSVTGSAFGIDLVLLTLDSAAADIIQGTLDAAVGPQSTLPPEAEPIPEGTAADPRVTDDVASRDSSHQHTTHVQPTGDRRIADIDDVQRDITNTTADDPTGSDPPGNPDQAAAVRTSDHQAPILSAPENEATLTSPTTATEAVNPITVTTRPDEQVVASINTLNDINQSTGATEKNAIFISDDDDSSNDGREIPPIAPPVTINQRVKVSAESFLKIRHTLFPIIGRIGTPEEETEGTDGTFGTSTGPQLQRNIHSNLDTFKEYLNDIHKSRTTTSRTLYETTLTLYHRAFNTRAEGWQAFLLMEIERMAYAFQHPYAPRMPTETAPDDDVYHFTLSHFQYNTGGDPVENIRATARRVLNLLHAYKDVEVNQGWMKYVEDQANKVYPM